MQMGNIRNNVGYKGLRSSSKDAKKKKGLLKEIWSSQYHEMKQMREVKKRGKARERGGWGQKKAL